MFLAEPSPSQGDLHFNLFGFPVRIHPLFWLTAVFLGSSDKDPLLVAMWVVAVLLCILLHELGHAVVMEYFGFRPSIVLYGFGGMAIPHPGRYGARRPGPWGDMLIAFAGPASGFILAAILAFILHFLFGYKVLVFEPSWRDVSPLVIVPQHLYVAMFLDDIFYISVWWGLVNLLPIYPLDGGLISQQVFFLNNPHDAVRQSLIVSVIVGALMTVLALWHWKDTQYWGDFYLVVFFAWLSYSNYTMLQSHGGWR